MRSKGPPELLIVGLWIIPSVLAGRRGIEAGRQLRSDQAGFQVPILPIADRINRSAARRTNVRLPGSFLLVAGLAVAGEQSLERVLQRTSDVYSRVREYSVRVKTGAAGEINGGGLGVRPDLDSSILVVRSGSRFRYEYHTPVSKGVWLTNGETEWHWRQDLREYQETPALPWPKEAGPGPGLPGIDWKYFTKFRALHTALRTATLIDDNVEPDTDCAEPTLLIEIALSETPARVRERLWIGERTGLVCRSSLVRSGVLRGTIQRLERTTVWKYERLEGPIDSTPFEYSPPKGVRKVRDFHRSSVPDAGRW